MQVRQRKRIVFISHEASLSGAPILLLNLLILLKNTPGYSIRLVVKRHGPYLPNFQAEFDTIVLKGEHYSRWTNYLQRLLNILGNRWRLTKIFFFSIFADVVFSNTITNGKLLKTLSPFKRKVVTYVHELSNVIEWYRSLGESSESFLYSARFAYPSIKVKKTLVDDYQVPEGKLFRLSYYFPFEIAESSDAIKAKFIDAFKNHYNLAGHFIIGNAGVLCKRKGTDLFIKVCEKVSLQNNDIKFCWIGKFENSEIEDELTQMIRDRQLEAHIILTGALPHDPLNFSPFDVLFLSSREDPYPLVVLEAAFMAVPSICFENAGGISEFVSDDAGWLINDFSVDYAAAKILELYSIDRRAIRAKGERAFEKVLALHADKNVILKQLDDLLSNL